MIVAQHEKTTWIWYAVTDKCQINTEHHHARVPDTHKSLRQLQRYGQAWQIKLHEESSKMHRLFSHCTFLPQPLLNHVLNKRIYQLQHIPSITPLPTLIQTFPCNCFTVRLPPIPAVFRSQEGRLWVGDSAQQTDKNQTAAPAPAPLQRASQTRLGPRSQGLVSGAALSRAAAVSCLQRLLSSRSRGGGSC